jgi:membrane fusion protein, multidrug efflux system
VFDPDHSADATDQMSDTSELKPANAAPPKNPWRRPVVGAVALALCLLLGVYLFVPDLIRAKTDDAYVEAHIEAISARVSGYVEALHIDDNSRVKQGQVLLELDPRDYQVRVDTAVANRAAAESRLAEARAQVHVAADTVEVAEADAATAAANAHFATNDLQRFSNVSDVRAVSTQRLDTARTAAETAHAALIAARTRVEEARAQAELAAAQERTAEAALEQAQAARRQAELDLSYTHIVAPENGTVANKLVEAGVYVQPGQTLLSLVPTTVYVVANFKETQLEGIRPGNRATVRIDSFPRLKLRGHVDSIQRGSGSRFALLPPENATGNFVKIVQRIPVKIVLDESPDVLSGLAPGMSAVVSVRYSQK